MALNWEPPERWEVTITVSDGLLGPNLVPGAAMAAQILHEAQEQVAASARARGRSLEGVEIHPLHRALDQHRYTKNQQHPSTRGHVPFRVSGIFKRRPVM